MTEISINGHGLTQLRVLVSNVGPWIAECDLQENPTITDRATIRAGSLTLTGTVGRGGEYGLQRRVRVVAGAAGWSNEIKSKPYHNDAGVKARLVAEDAARECGETLGQFIPTDDRLGRDYVRSAGVAARTLEACSGGVPWWVDYAGITQVGPRAAVDISPDRVQVLSYDPRSRIALLAPDDPTDVAIGGTLPQLPSQGVIREYQIDISPKQFRVTAWLSTGENESGKLASIMRRIIQRTTDAPLWGLYRYRVVSVAGDGRLDLQAVRKASGLPDVATVSQWPGIAGTASKPAPSSEVLIAFIDGDPTQPIVTHYSGQDGAGFVPTSIVLGGSDGPNAARVGDDVEVLLPPGTFTGTIGGAPATGVIVWPASKTMGSITSGSGKVKIA